MNRAEYLTKPCPAWCVQTHGPDRLGNDAKIHETARVRFIPEEGRGRGLEPGTGDVETYLSSHETLEGRRAVQFADIRHAVRHRRGVDCGRGAAGRGAAARPGRAPGRGQLVSRATVTYEVDPALPEVPALRYQDEDGTHYVLQEDIPLELACALLTKLATLHAGPDRLDELQQA